MLQAAVHGSGGAACQAMQQCVISTAGGLDTDVVGLQVDRVVLENAHKFLLPNGTWQEGFIPRTTPVDDAKPSHYYVDG